MKYECHGHIIADGISYQESMCRHKNTPDATYIRRAFEAIVKHGIGYYRDGGDKYLVSALAKKIAGEYGVEYRTPVFIAHKLGYYGSMYGYGYENPRDFMRLISLAKRHDADFIKLTTTGMLDFAGDGGIMGPALNGDELTEIVKMSHGEGFPVMAHVNGADAIKLALEAGADSIEHGFWPDETVIAYFLESNAVWVPTRAAVANIIGTKRFSEKTLGAILEAQKKVLVEAYNSGVLVASGSDCGAWMVEQGAGTDEEIDLLETLGIDPDCGNRAIAERFRKAY